MGETLQIEKEEVIANLTKALEINVELIAEVDQLKKCKKKKKKKDEKEIKAWRKRWKF